MPSAPACETAAASRGTAGPPIGAWTIGCSMPRRSQSGVRMSRGYAPVVGRVYDSSDEKLAAWIEQQHLFFVATAPLAEDGHVNVSPKGDLRWFRILGPREVGYLDFVGSGAETIAHARENGRIVVMFCAFEGPDRKGGLRRCRSLGPRGVGYLDCVGSGAETIAHARENGRIVVMFCAFEG